MCFHDLKPTRFLFSSVFLIGNEEGGDVTGRITQFAWHFKFKVKVAFVMCVIGFFLLPNMKEVLKNKTLFRKENEASLSYRTTPLYNFPFVSNSPIAARRIAFSLSPLASVFEIFERKKSLLFAGRPGKKSGIDL